VWLLGAKGHDLLQRYIPHVPPQARLDLARPSTALEHEEWRVRLHLRTLLLRLVLEARRAPLLQALEIQLPRTRSWPTAWGQAPQSEPDALVSVVWSPATSQRDDWLPWLPSRPVPTGAIHYPIYLERTHALSELAELLPIWAATWPEPRHIPVVVLRDDDRYTVACRELANLQPAAPVCLTTWTALDAGIGHDLWWNARDAADTSQPLLDQQVG